MSFLLKVITFLFIFNVCCGFYDHSGLYGSKTGITAYNETNYPNSGLESLTDIMKLPGVIGDVVDILITSQIGGAQLLGRYVGNELMFVVFTAPLSLLIILFLFQAAASKAGFQVHFFK